MSLQLQGLVDSLERRLQRSVAVKDCDLRLLVHTAQHGEADTARERVILDREPPPGLLDWVAAQGLFEAEGPVRLPREARFGVEPRVAIPIRWDDTTLGFLWLIDRDESLDDEDMRIASHTAEQAAAVMSRERLAAQLWRAQRGAVARDLLDPESSQAEQAAHTAIEGGFLVPAGIRVACIDAGPLDELRRAKLQEVVGVATELFGDGGALGHVRHDHAAVIMSTADPEVRAEEGERVGWRLHEWVHGRLGDPLRIGVGSAVDAPEYAHRSYREARAAAEVADVVPELGPVARWDRLGVFGLLMQLPDRGRTLIPPELAALAGTNDELLGTVEVFLDEAGRVTRAAERLHVHRTTLHYRLGRFAEMTGIDLDSGHDRLRTHLSIKSLRMTTVARNGV